MLEFLHKFSHRSTAVSDTPAPLPTVPEALTHHLPVGKALYSDLQALRFQGTRERQVTPQGHDATKQPVCGSTLLKPDFPLPGTCAHLHANLLPTDPIVLMTPPGYKEGLAWAHACVNERISCLVDLDPPEQRPAHCMDRDRIHEGVFLRADFKREPDTAPPSGISAVERFEVSLQHLPQPGDAARTQRVRRLVAPIVPNEPVKPQQVLDLVQAIEDQEQVEGRTVAFQCSDDHSAGLMAVALAAYRRLKNGDEVSVEDLNDFVLQKCAEVRASRNVDIFEAHHLTTLVAFNHLALTRQKEKAPTGARCMSGGAVAPFENTACAGATALAATRSPMPVGLCAVREDITKLEVDAIVNAAKPSLEGGGGVDGAIHRAAGRKLRQFCKTLGGCETGQAKVTPGFELPARLIVHTVGPIWRGGKHDEARLLADCYRNALEAALSSNARSVAFPCISTGSYGFPADEAAKTAVRTATDFLARSSAVMNVIFCCSSARDLQLYQGELGLVRA